MLGNILRPRRSTATSPGFRTSPAASQPTAPEPPSKLLSKLKAIKKIIVLRPLSKKQKPVTAGHKSEKEGSRLLSSVEAHPTFVPTPSTALDNEYRRAAPVLPYQDFGPGLLLMDDVPRTSASPAPPLLGPSSVFPFNASATIASATYPSPLRQRGGPTFQNVAESLRAGVNSPLAEVGSIVQDLLAEEGQEASVKVSKQPKRVVLHSAPFVQSYSAEVDWWQPADSQFLRASNAPAERKKAPRVEGNKSTDANQDLQQRKLYWAKRVMEYRQSQAPFCKAEDGQNQVQPEATRAVLAQSRVLHPRTNTLHSPLVGEELAEQAHGLKRSQGIQRQRQLHARHPSKASQDSNMAVENEPIFRRDSLCMARESPRWSGQGVHSTIAYEAQGPNPWSMGKSNDEPSLLQTHTAQPTLETARTPLGLLNGGAPLSTQAAAEDDDDADDASSSSYDHATQTSAPEPSLWLGMYGLGGGPSHY